MPRDNAQLGRTPRSVLTSDRREAADRPAHVLLPERQFPTLCAPILPTPLLHAPTQVLKSGASSGVNLSTADHALGAWVRTREGGTVFSESSQHKNWSASNSAKSLCVPEWRWD